MIVFLGNGRCYHTFDWIRAIERNRPDLEWVMITDLIESEGYPSQIKPEDLVLSLMIVDRFLMRNLNRAANIWRNALRFVLLPMQVIMLKRRLSKIEYDFIHAHTMYYVVLARLAGLNVIGTPQGSEILVRPWKSKIYKAFCAWGLRGCSLVTVDSEAMRRGVMAISGRDAVVVQNGVQTDVLESYRKRNLERDLLVSFRGVTSLYRIEDFFIAACSSDSISSIQMFYPFCDEEYKQTLLNTYQRKLLVEDLGRLSQEDMYSMFSRALLAISIPSSDSSPRSVYEAIFSGAVVAVSNLDWLTGLTKCMRERVIVVNLNDSKWLEKALTTASVIVKKEYIPSNEAIEKFDENRSLFLFTQNHYTKTPCQ